MAALKAVGLALALLATTVAGAADHASYDTAVTAAAHRFDLPQDWIRAVIKAESGGDANAVSAKGALGLMQLMPDTWAEMRDRYSIQSDVLDPAANIMAGSAYLAEMRHRFGYPGLFAAYNAGPARYESHLRYGVPLPAETQAYLAKLDAKLGLPAGSPGRLFVPLDSSDSRLFAPLSKAGTTGR
ncbi:MULTISPECIES: lytic transglycosylase domain-containing protein [unclassified Azospirillum]|uniref:lytic transglycosylase domain-containing protein n=1 Tax=unclassified Azospirillum TaxID=2630922 RepID=UPI000B72379F|nr:MULTISPECIES: lytic transglycosylase domain-containing protein [unclassified Azospirillum]SNT09895.1 Transglycosylase SLT domain-containing protein [Azospirillum sp. RU38E]SNT25388.1 Transglycosylase SLT domain-containing protein [Azospirillum sp. RU37A]